MKYTSAEANKLIKKLEEKIRMLLLSESKASVFNAASGEDTESLRPEYNFEETQIHLEELQEKLRKAKHAINCFNIQKMLPGFDDLTIDQALILIPQLNNRKAELLEMASRLPKERVQDRYSSGNIIDYVITNYDAKEVQQKYEEVDAKLAAIQLALDEANSKDLIEIDIDL